MSDVVKVSGASKGHTQSCVQPLSFRVVANDGGEHSFEYACENILRDDSVCFCSAAKENVNVLLEVSNAPSFNLTNIVVVSPSREQYTSPVNLGLVFVSWEAPALEDLKCWDDVATCQEFEELLEQRRAAGTPEEMLPVLFLQLEHSTRTAFELPVALSGRYVLLKFLRSTSGLGDNIDVQYVGLAGWCGPKQFNFAALA